jgi:adenylate cyclase
VTKALSQIDEALALVELSGERFWEAELHRLKGELLLKRGTEEAEAEACFQRAIEVARGQRVRSWELRAATSLSRGHRFRCRQGQGKQAEAREILQEIYGWFSEGFDTADLQEARKLLGTLA